MSIKTYPLQFTKEKLTQIGDAAGKGKIKSFIHAAIDEKLEYAPIRDMKIIWRDLIEELDVIILKTGLTETGELEKLYEKRELLESAFARCTV